LEERSGGWKRLASIWIAFWYGSCVLLSNRTDDFNEQSHLTTLPPIYRVATTQKAGTLRTQGLASQFLLSDSQEAVPLQQEAVRTTMAIISAVAALRAHV
jgi:hypothetical protein